MFLFYEFSRFHKAGQLIFIEQLLLLLALGFVFAVYLLRFYEIIGHLIVHLFFDYVLTHDFVGMSLYFAILLKYPALSSKILEKMFVFRTILSP